MVKKSKLWILAAALPLLAACGEREASPPPPTMPPQGEPAPTPPPPLPEPPATPPAETTPPETVPAPQTEAPPPEPAAPAAGVMTGESIYKSTCAVCHAPGIAGAPRLGDKADWEPRIAQGQEVLYEHSIKGFTGQKGVMPPKGGNTSLSDEDVKAAVDYMVEQAR